MERRSERSKAKRREKKSVHARPRHTMKTTMTRAQILQDALATLNQSTHKVWPGRAAFGGGPSTDFHVLKKKKERAAKPFSRPRRRADTHKKHKAHSPHVGGGRPQASSSRDPERAVGVSVRMAGPAAATAGVVVVGGGWWVVVGGRGGGWWPPASHHRPPTRALAAGRAPTMTKPGAIALRQRRGQ
jgi:hypothetical protein